MYPLNVNSVKENWENIGKIVITIANPTTKEILAEKIESANEILAFDVLANCFDEKFSVGGSVDDEMPKRNKQDPRLTTFSRIEKIVRNLVESLTIEQKAILNNYLIETILNKKLTEWNEEFFCSHHYDYDDNFYFDYNCDDYDCDRCDCRFDCKYYISLKESRIILNRMKKDYSLEKFIDNLFNCYNEEIWFIKSNLFWGYNPRGTYNNPRKAIIKITYR